MVLIAAMTGSVFAMASAIASQVSRLVDNRCAGKPRRRRTNSSLAGDAAPVFISSTSAALGT
jgi:hypothetical protein